MDLNGPLYDSIYDDLVRRIVTTYKPVDVNWYPYDTGCCDEIY